jgi:hypothetical protein
MKYMLKNNILALIFLLIWHYLIKTIFYYQVIYPLPNLPPGGKEYQNLSPLGENERGLIDS